MGESMLPDPPSTAEALMDWGLTNADAFIQGFLAERPDAMFGAYTLAAVTMDLAIHLATEHPAAPAHDVANMYAAFLTSIVAVLRRVMPEDAQLPPSGFLYFDVELEVES